VEADISHMIFAKPSYPPLVTCFSFSHYYSLFGCRYLCVDIVYSLAGLFTDTGRFCAHDCYRALKKQLMERSIGATISQDCRVFYIHE